MVSKIRFFLAAYGCELICTSLVLGRRLQPLLSLLHLQLLIEGLANTVVLQFQSRLKMLIEKLTLPVLYKVSKHILHSLRTLHRIRLLVL